MGQVYSFDAKGITFTNVVGNWGVVFCSLSRVSGLYLHLSDIENNVTFFCNRISAHTVTEGEHDSFCDLFVEGKLKHM